VLTPRGCICDTCENACDCCSGRTVTTDNSGHFTVSVPAGLYNVRTVYANVSKDEPSGIEVKEDKTRKIEVDLGVATTTAAPPQ
jgi:hypothetical protein